MWLTGNRIGLPGIDRQCTGGFASHRGSRFEFGREFPDQLGGDRVFILYGFSGDNRLGAFERLGTRHLQHRQPLLDRVQRNFRLLQQTMLSGRLRVQTPDANGLADSQSEQRAQQRFAELFVEYPAEHQPNQHQHPLHGRYP
ncbi:hypothetical protein D3C76_1386190 [compost metagenome]